MNFFVVLFRLPPKDMKVLAGNFEELVQFQQMLYNLLDDCSQ